MSGMSDETPAADVSAKPPQRFRRLGIAVSVFFGVLTVALVLLWVLPKIVVQPAESDRMPGSKSSLLQLNGGL
jgi:hypothetical protein